MADLPENNVVAKLKIDKALIKSADWLAAKKSDLEAGRRIIDGLWSAKKTEAVRNLIDDPDNAVYLTMPSSTGKNILPISLAAKLSDETGIRYEIGEDYFSAIHNKEIKKLSRVERIFFERKYAAVDPIAFNEKFSAKQVIIMEDLLTTGGSVKYFANTLRENGARVASVIGLMGDRRLNVDEKSKERLSSSLKKAGMDIDAKKIENQLTRTEAGYLIMAVNGARSENAKTRLAENLQRLLDRGADKDLERHRDTTGHIGHGRGHIGHEGVFERVQARSSRNPRTITKEGYQITVEMPGRSPVCKNICLDLRDQSKGVLAAIESEARDFALQNVLREKLTLKEANCVVIRVEKNDSEKSIERDNGQGKATGREERSYLTMRI